MILVVGFKILDRVAGKGCGACAKAVDNFLRVQKEVLFARSHSLKTRPYRPRLRLRRAWQGKSARFGYFPVFLSCYFVESERNLRKC